MPTAERQTSNSNQQTAISNQLLLLALLILSFAVRLHALLQLPGFVDEGNHLLWAAEVWQGRIVFPFATAKPLEIFYLAAFLPFRAPLWAGRFSSLLTGVITLSAIYSLARGLGHRRAGLLAAAFYALLPWTFFHERLAIADPLTTAIAILLAWIAVQWNGAHAKGRKIPRFCPKPGDFGLRRRTFALTACLLSLPLAKLSADTRPARAVGSSRPWPC